ncbi:ABC transporter ATP-binding protein [Roseovarius spongiae]|uniref:ABC transporter ATP-binding protein n=1 Tax=Roseovarius spongiae TaxID=2320272 RepID=A0A3A8B8V7_9RHOB|nr:ABC transporter ATP-binding protein [Roseovarius spongiae]RKF14158.1 ABC transporter ATP-binding protein [Roseovarius spongiae]
MAFLELHGLTKRFGDFAAVDDLTFTVERGSFVSLLGPSGCGKTTTLQMVAGFETPTEGKIILDGKDLSGIPARERGLGIVFQTYALFTHMTVEENVGFGLEMRKVSRAERKRRVADALDLVHLSHLGNRYPRQMSGGQRQRVALARALVIEPQLLLLDEPLSNLDAKLREEMQLELRRIQREANVTTLMVTHDQSEALALSDSIVVIDHGRLRQDATPFDVYETPQSSFVSRFLGKSNNFSARLESAGPDGSKLVCGSLDLQGPRVDLAPGPVEIALRPERITLVGADAGQLRGTVAERVFMGNQWLLRIETEIGDMLVMRYNTGRAEAEQGATVGLSWKPEDIRILPAEETSA